MALLQCRDSWSTTGQHYRSRLALIYIAMIRLVDILLISTVIVLFAVSATHMYVANALINVFGVMIS
jgi:hypothetical protein